MPGNEPTIYYASFRTENLKNSIRQETAWMTKQCVQCSDLVYHFEQHVATKLNKICTTVKIKR